MIFLDSSAVYAWADKRDPNHETAKRRLQAILDDREELLTHNYLMVEAVSLIQARLGHAAAAKFAKDSAIFVIEWVDRDLHASAVREWQKSGKRWLSFVDQVSFIVMRRRSVTTAFSFDPDFQTQGFQLFGA